MDANSKNQSLVVPRFDLTRFPTLRALAMVLMNRAEEHPGVPVSPTELIEAAWPDERMLPKAARNRLHVSIHKLRRQFFGNSLVRTRRGYFLTPMPNLSGSGQMVA